MTNPTRDARRGRTFLSAIAVGLLAAALVSGSSLAGKPSGGGGGGGKGGGKPGGTLTAQVVVSPNPVPAYSTFTLTAVATSQTSASSSTCTRPASPPSGAALIDGNGCLLDATGWASSPGSAQVDVLEGSVTRVASTTFEIK